MKNACWWQFFSGSNVFRAEIDQKCLFLGNLNEKIAVSRKFLPESPRAGS